MTKKEKEIILDVEAFEKAYNEIHGTYPFTSYKKTIYDLMIRKIGNYENKREGFELDIPKGKKLS